MFVFVSIWLFPHLETKETKSTLLWTHTSKWVNDIGHFSNKNTRQYLVVLLFLRDAKNMANSYKYLKNCEHTNKCWGKASMSLLKYILQLIQVNKDSTKNQNEWKVKKIYPKQWRRIKNLGSSGNRSRIWKTR